MAWINKLTIRVRVVNDPSSRPREEWTLDSGNDLELDVQESELDEELTQLFKAAGAHSAFLLERTVRSGGWGATGLSVMDLLVTVGTGVATSALYDSLKALFEKFVHRAPEFTKKQRKVRTKKVASRRASARRRRS